MSEHGKRMTNSDSNDQFEKKLGDFLAVSQGAINNALTKQTTDPGDMTHNKPIGQLLLESGAISQDELNNAIKMQRIKRLSRCPVFSTLNQTDLAALSSRFHEVSVPEQKEFIVQGDDDPTMYVMATGTAAVYHTNVEGRMKVIAILGPGDPIGEMAYFTGGLRTASVRTLETCELLCADYSDLTFYFEHAPKVAHAFTKLVENRQDEIAKGNT